MPSFKLSALLIVFAVFTFASADAEAQSGHKSSPLVYEKAPRNVETQLPKIQGPLSASLTAESIIAVFDGNGDGAISKKEVQNVLVLLTNLDANSDGRIAGREIKMGTIAALHPKSGRGADGSTMKDKRSMRNDAGSAEFSANQR